MDFYVDKKAEDFIISLGPEQGRKVTNVKENLVGSIGVYNPIDTRKIQGCKLHKPLSKVKFFERR